MGKSKELALQQEVTEVAKQPGVRKDVVEKVHGIHSGTALGSMFFGLGGGIVGMFSSIPAFLIPGMNPEIPMFSLTGLGMFSTGYWSSKWLQSSFIEDPIDNTFGKGTTKKFNYFILRRTLKEKRQEIPIETGRVSATGEEILKATLVTSIRGIRLETLVREDAGTLWDKHINTVKDAYKIDAYRLNPVRSKQL